MKYQTRQAVRLALLALLVGGMVALLVWTLGGCTAVFIRSAGDVTLWDIGGHGGGLQIPARGASGPNLDPLHLKH